jgi:hypothetical protein
MKSSSATWRVIAIGQCILSVTFAAFAAAPIINIDPSNPLPYWGSDESHGNGMVGWTFQLLQPFTVTQVGWYDANSDGLSRAFQVGLWKGEADTNNAATPKFVSGTHYSSLIGDPDKGLTIPPGSNASLNGFWRVVDLDQPLLLQPGFYEIGGLDSSNTTDVIKYVAIGMPLTNAPTPFGAPLWVGLFFYAGGPPSPVSQEGLQPTSDFYLYWGLELGPMLFGTVSTQKLHIRPCLIEPSTPGISLTWSTGTLWEADEVAGPYTVVTNATSPFAVPTSSRQRFYRLQP